MQKERTVSLVYAPSVKIILHNAFGDQAAGDHSGGHPRAGMRAGSDEIQVFITGMPVRGPEVRHLRQRMRQSVGGAFHQVISFGPRRGSTRLFELNVRFEVGDAEEPQPAKYLLARLIPKRFPILLPVFTQVTDRDDGRQGILSWRSHGGIEPGRSVDIQAGIGR